MTRTVIVVPTYNECDNLPVLASRLTPLDDSVHVLVVDDASPDATGAIADELAAGSERFHVLHRAGARGYAGACRAGIEWALARDYDRVMTMDADLSHDPERVPALIEAVEAGADVSIGSRYVPGGALVVDWSPFRHAVSKLGSAYARLMVGARVRDCTSGFRCYRASMLRDAAVDETRSEGYSFLIEVLSAMRRLGARVAEVPITYVDRCAGSSKISRRIIVEAFLLATREGVARALGRRRVRVAR